MGRYMWGHVWKHLFIIRKSCDWLSGVENSDIRLPADDCWTYDFYVLHELVQASFVCGVWVCMWVRDKEEKQLNKDSQIQNSAPLTANDTRAHGQKETKNSLCVLSETESPDTFKHIISYGFTHYLMCHILEDVTPFEPVYPCPLFFLIHSQP